MIFISIFLILLLLGVTLWLWRLSQAQFIHLAVFAADQEVTAYPVHRLRLVFSLLREYWREYNLSNLSESGLGIVGRQGPGIIMTVVSMLLLPFIDRQRTMEIIVNSSKLYPRMARYTGIASLPKKVYEGDSKNITLILNRESFVQGLHAEHLRSLETTVDKQPRQQITLDIQEKDSSEQFLEVRLLAAAFPTKGEEKQRQSLTLERLEYRWNCYFQTAGRHELALELKVIHPSGERTLAVIERRVRVVKLDHMTQFQIRIASGVGGIITLVGIVVAIILNIHQLGAK